LVNNTEINVEDLKAGDWILNKDSFPTHVRGHVSSPYKSHQKVIKINDELVCTWDQIFIGADNFYYVYNGCDNQCFTKENSKIMSYISYDDTIITRPFVGLPENLIKNLEVGVVLQTIDGEKTVDTLEIIDIFETLPASKDYIVDLYSKDISEIDIDNLSVWDYNDRKTMIVYHIIGNSATYIVNGYKCVSIPNNSWDYENDTLIDPETYEIVEEDEKYLRIPI
jgi:hypothetical protein